MQIKVVLYALLREKLPPEARGRGVLEMPPGSSIADVLARLEITGMVAVSLNGEIANDHQTRLKEGDEMQCFRPVGGG